MTCLVSNSRLFSFSGANFLLFVCVQPPEAASPGSEALVLVQESSFSFTESVMNVYLDLSPQEQHTLVARVVLVAVEEFFA